jgi:hypothetical protein
MSAKAKPKRKIKSIFEILDKDKSKDLDNNELKPTRRQKGMIIKIDPMLGHQIRSGKRMVPKTKKKVTLTEFERLARDRKRRPKSKFDNQVNKVRRARAGFHSSVNVFNVKGKSATGTRRAKPFQ